MPWVEPGFPLIPFCPQHFQNYGWRGYLGFGVWQYTAGVFDHVEVLSANEFYASGRYLVLHSSDGAARLMPWIFPAHCRQVPKPTGGLSFVSPTEGYALSNAAFFGGTSWLSYTKLRIAGGPGARFTPIQLAVQGLISG
ncbi:MAG: hypothetical protein U5L96_17465 [Owenweeksia sp.]|nr:hypothetical protein [Owenweeksia sp.]